MTSRAQPLHFQGLCVVVVVCFQMIYAAAALTPQRNNNLPPAHFSANEIMRISLVTIMGAVSLLALTVSFEIAVLTRKFALVFSHAISAPGLNSIKASLANSKFVAGLFLFAPRAGFHQNGTSDDCLWVTVMSRIAS